MAVLSVQAMRVEDAAGMPLTPRVSFTLSAGECLALTGTSGSGKSSLLRAILGVLPEGLAATGSVSFGHAGVGEQHRSIGYCAAEPLSALPPFHTCRSFLRQAIDRMADDDAQARERWQRCLQMLSEFGLDPDEVLHKYPRELSGGQQQRILLLHALANEPAIIVLDEPNSALDAASTRTLIDVLSRNKTRGAAILLCSHDRRLVAAVADREEFLDGTPAPLVTGAAHTARTGAPLVELRGVEKSYAMPTGPRIIIENMDLRVGAGERIALVGSSGSGKTTLARLLSGLESPDRGVVFLDDTPIGIAPPVRVRQFGRSVAFVAQDTQGALAPHLPIGETIADVIRAGRRADVDVAAETARRLRQVGLSEDLAGCLPHELSGGQRQRAAIARALAAEPQLLVLDEPTSGLDVRAKMHIVDLLIELQQASSLAMVICTHDPDVLAAFSGRDVDVRIPTRAVPE